MKATKEITLERIERTSILLGGAIMTVLMACITVLFFVFVN